MKLRQTFYCFFLLLKGDLAERKGRGELWSGVTTIERDADSNGDSGRIKGSNEWRVRGR